MSAFATPIHYTWRKHDVLADRQMREEVVALEDDADIGAESAQRLGVSRKRVPGNLDTTGMDVFQAVHAAQQGALSRARPAD